MFDSEPDTESLDLPRAIAFGRFSAVPRPFLRWAGSKQALIPQLMPILPQQFGRYYEPFLGSGALFFHLKPKAASLTDVSGELIDLWTAVRDSPDTLIDYLKPLKPDKTLYYKIRENRSLEKVIRAAEFLYLNKTCWNGLYRVNSNGKFNVPYGAPRSDFIFDEQNLLACARILKRSSVTIRKCDFVESLQRARRGDLVYLDPPYVTQHNNNGFRDWNEKLFRWEDQERLARQAKALKERGAFVVVSNANHQDIRNLYQGFKAHVVSRSSTLSSDSSFRGRVTELVLTANLP